MRARQILSKNLRALIDHAKEHNPRLGAIRKVAAASNGKLTNGTVGRIAAGSHTTDIDALADLAEVFGLQPWQLLVEGINPNALPVLASPELLSQIRQLVHSVPARTEPYDPSFTDEQAVKGRRRTEPTQVGPALQEAFTNAQGADSSKARTANRTQAKRPGRSSR